MGTKVFTIATVLIVDDFAPWRAEVRRILAVRPEWVIVGEACDGLEAVQKATEFQPDNRSCPAHPTGVSEVSNRLSDAE